LKWEDFLALPQTDDISDFHCVTTWSKLDMAWRAFDGLGSFGTT
jgi:DMSO/TMAO reductase YedYZ molybdopterin-dependent catalytic subunit